MERNFIHLPFNMLFYLILKRNSKNGVLYGLNKEHVNFIAHHETKFSPAVGQAGSDHYPVTVRVGQLRQGHWLVGGSRSPFLSSRLAARHAGHCIQVFPQRL